MWWDSALDSGREAVALEFADGHIVELPNVVAEGDGRHFEVPGHLVLNVLEFNMLVHGPPVALLHTHKERWDPSILDIAALPDWLEVGRIRVLADGSLTTYNRFGLISRSYVDNPTEGDASNAPAA